MILKDGRFFLDSHESTFIFFVSHRKLYSTWQWRQELPSKQYQVEFQTSFLLFACLYWEMAPNKCYLPPPTMLCCMNAGLPVFWKMWQWKQRKLRSHDALYVPRTVLGKMAGGRKKERQARFLFLSEATDLDTTMCDKTFILQLTSWTKHDQASYKKGHGETHKDIWTRLKRFISPPPPGPF